MDRSDILSFLRGKDACEKNMGAEQSLARALHKKWDFVRAVVLVDWCEERGLFGVSKAIRKGPSANTRAKIEALYSCLSVKQVGSVMTFWRLDWLPGHEMKKKSRTEKIMMLNSVYGKKKIPRNLVMGAIER